MIPGFLSSSLLASLSYSLLEGAKEEEGGAGCIKVDPVSSRAAAFFVNTRQIKSAEEAIVVAGNCCYMQLKKRVVGGSGRLPPEIY